MVRHSRYGRRRSRRSRVLPGTTHHHRPARVRRRPGLDAPGTAANLASPTSAATATAASYTEHVGDQDATKVGRKDDVDAEVDARVKDDEIVCQSLDVVVRLSAVERVYAESEQQSLEQSGGLTDDEDDNDDDEDHGDAVVAGLLPAVQRRRPLVDRRGRAPPTTDGRQQAHCNEDERRQRHYVHHQVEAHVLVDDLEPEASADVTELHLSNVVERQIGQTSNRRVHRWVVDPVLEDPRQTVAESEHWYNGNVNFRLT